MITLEEITTFLKKLLGNIVFQFIYPLIVFGITFLIVEEGKSLSYQILATEKISTSINQEELDLIGNNPIKNVRRDYIAIYNNGNEFIDNSDFIKKDHITLTKRKDSIINVEIYKKNRKSLAVQTVTDSLSSDKILFNLIDNEVFELKDVVVLKVLYKQKGSGVWVIESRIKGVSKGISKGISKGNIHKNEAKVIRSINIITVS